MQEPCQCGYLRNELAKARKKIDELEKSKNAPFRRDIKAPITRPNAVHMLFASGPLPRTKQALDSIRAYIQKLEVANEHHERNQE